MTINMYVTFKKNIYVIFIRLLSFLCGAQWADAVLLSCARRHPWGSRFNSLKPFIVSYNRQWSLYISMVHLNMCPALSSRHIDLSVLLNLKPGQSRRIFISIYDYLWGRTESAVIYGCVCAAVVNKNLLLARGVGIYWAIKSDLIFLVRRKSLGTTF